MAAPLTVEAGGIGGAGGVALAAGAIVEGGGITGAGCRRQ